MDGIVTVAGIGFAVENFGVCVAGSQPSDSVMLPTFDLKKDGKAEGARFKPRL